MLKKDSTYFPLLFSANYLSTFTFKNLFSEIGFPLFSHLTCFLALPWLFQKRVRSPLLLKIHLFFFFLQLITIQWSFDCLALSHELKRQSPQSLSKEIYTIGIFISLRGLRKDWQEALKNG